MMKERMKEKKWKNKTSISWDTGSVAVKEAK